MKTLFIIGLVGLVFVMGCHQFGVSPLALTKAGIGQSLKLLGI